MKRMLVLIAAISVFAFTAQTHAITVVLNGTITETGLPGYINVGDLFEVTITTNDHQIDSREDVEGSSRSLGIFHDLISWDWRFLEGSTGSYTGASLGDASSYARVMDSHVDDYVDYFAFKVFEDVISDSLGDAQFRSWSVMLEDNDGSSNNGDGKTLIEQSNNYEILRSWNNLEYTGVSVFYVDTMGHYAGALATIDSVVIIPEPCSLLLLSLGGLLLRIRKS